MKTKLLFIFLFFSSALFSQSQVVLITGASRGIGLETAKLLASQGYTVYASMRSVQEVPCDSLHLLELDITSDESVNKAIDQLLAKEGRLDVLINNAGAAVFGPIELITIEQAKKVFELNFFGTMRLMQAALPIMRTQNSGLIINLSSTSGVRPSPGWDIYGASKFALEGLSEAVAAVASQWNIDVVLVEPGTCATNFMAQSTEVGARHADGYSQFMPNALRWMNERLAQGQNPQDVAYTIASIITDAKRHIRYQTSSKGVETVAKRLVDPTGDSSVQEQRELVNGLFTSTLDAQQGPSFVK